MIKAIHGNSEVEIKKIESESVDIICIDPPYLYLKNQKLERAFDELMFFSECKRILCKNGFIVLFGRGESFYRWNTILSDLGFIFKEEIVWDKRHGTSPLMNLYRVHETISIFSKGKSSINKVKVPYLEMKGHDIDAIISDVKRLCVVFNNPKSMIAVREFFETNARDVSNDNVSVSSNKSIIRTDRVECDNFTKFNVTTDKRKSGDRCANAAQSIDCGMTEKSIIRQTRDHYTAIHPTQKPVRLLERLLMLCIPKQKQNVVVADFFAGSFSCAEACYNLGLDFVGIEIDKEYYEAGLRRIQGLKGCAV